MCFSFSSKKWRSWRMKMAAMLVDYGGPVRLDWVLPALTLIAPSLMPGTTNPIMRFSNPNFKPSILSAMKIKEKESELFPFNPTVTSLLRWEIRGWGLPYLTTIDEPRELQCQWMVTHRRRRRDWTLDSSPTPTTLDCDWDLGLGICWLLLG